MRLTKTQQSLYSGEKGEYNMRIMAIDYGDARTGIAISDRMGFLAGETRVINSRKEDVVVEAILDIVREYEITEIVLGYPKNMNGTIGPRAEKSEAFGQVLKEQTNLKVTLWDERRTTVDAHRILSETGNRGKKRKQKVDAVAATLILEGYLTRVKQQLD